MDEVLSNKVLSEKVLPDQERHHVDAVVTIAETAVRPLTADQLYRPADLSGLAFTTTADLQAVEGLVGQARAVEAIRFGTRVDKTGFNLFVIGANGARMQDAVKANPPGDMPMTEFPDVVAEPVRGLDGLADRLNGVPFANRGEEVMGRPPTAGRADLGQKIGMQDRNQTRRAKDVGDNFGRLDERAFLVDDGLHRPLVQVMGILSRLIVQLLQAPALLQAEIVELLGIETDVTSVHGRTRTAKT